MYALAPHVVVRRVQRHLFIGVTMKEFMLRVRNRIDHQSSWTGDQHREFLAQCEIYIAHLKRDNNLIAAQPLIREGAMISGTPNAWNAGPISDTGEVIVGYYHVRAKDLDDAVSIAKRNPEFAFGSTARVEVSPVKMKEVSTGFVYPDKTR